MLIMNGCKCGKNCDLCDNWGLPFCECICEREYQEDDISE